MPCCYILFSETTQSFYIGFTTDSIDVRLAKHNASFYQDKWSMRGKPWLLFLEIPCESVGQARQIESHIKRMKTKIYIQNLKLYPEMIEKLKIMYFK